MKNSLFLLIGLLLTVFSTTAQSYWQQEVDYTIQVRLDDHKHMLSGFETFVYHNHSPNTLDFLYIHLWPNAYNGSKTALEKQQYQDGDQLLRFGADSLKGFIDSLDFRVNDQPARLEYDPQNPDIAKLWLPESLKPGVSVTVSTSFRVKIPSGRISRLGHIGQSYQITQWYPKPAVYDQNGWNQIPYLNQGEFYSEFGSYDVSITLPKNYVVGATGDLQTESEYAFLEEKVDFTQKFLADGTKIKGDWNKFPPSSDTLKTIRYVQHKVHDFAWFADKRYQVLKGEITLPHSGRTVTSWAMFTPRNGYLWKESLEYIHDGIHYYSLWNGDYPYNQVTAVDGTISAGGGMEYPNVTVIGNCSKAIDLEVVIVHEVGHNWFYGILGTNERVHGWMDEGMNTLNEMRYVYTKYPENTYLSDMLFGGKIHFDHLSHYDSGDYMYRVDAGLGEDQPIETHSARFTSLNYGAIMYQKTGLVFNYLKQYLGDSVFDRCMRAYYDEWSFKHPEPKDMQQVLERVSGKDLNWLFHDLIQTTNHIDYKLAKVKLLGNQTRITVKNNGQVNGPIEVTGYQENKAVSTVWLEPGAKKQTLILEGKMDEVRVNASGKAPEIVQSNNNWHQKGLFGKIEPLTLQMLTGKNVPTQTNLFWSPILGGNHYDKFMLGIALHNFSIPTAKYQFLLAPMYSFGGNRISGIAEFSKTCLPARNIKMSRLGVSVRSFKNDTMPRNDGYYVSILPYWKAKLGNRIGGPVSQEIHLQTMYRLDVFGPGQRELVGGFLNYQFQFNKADHILLAAVRADYVANPVNSDHFTRGTFNATYKYRYLKNRKSRWVELRVFAGNYFNFDMYNSGNTVNYAMSLSGMSGGQDLFTEDYFFGRSALTGFYSQQRLDNWGGFRSVAGNGMTGYYGLTTHWMTSANLYLESPIGPRIFGLFADIGVFDSGFYTKYQRAFDAGLAIRIRDIFGIYFPVIMSNGMEQAYSSKNYLERIRFTLKFNLTNKWVNISNFL